MGKPSVSIPIILFQYDHFCDFSVLAFTLNGELLYDLEDSSIAFDNIDTSEGFMPGVTLSGEQRVEINFGHSSEELEYYPYLKSSGYIALCSAKALHYNIPIWYSSHGGFTMLGDTTHSQFKTTQRSGVISVSCRDWDYAMLSDQECFRLNMGCTVSSLSSSPLPTLLPRPGLLTPSPVAENTGFLLSDGLQHQQQQQRQRQQQQQVTSTPLSFTVVFSTGQVPCLAFLGWTTASFHYMESQFSSLVETEGEEKDQVFHKHQSCTAYGHQMVISNDRHDIDRGEKGGEGVNTPTTFRTAFMVCLCDLLPTFTPQLTAPVRWVWVWLHAYLPHVLFHFCRVCCTLDLSSGKIVFRSADVQSDAGEQVTYTAHNGAKLFPTVVVTPTTENVMDFDLKPAQNTRPLSSCFTTQLSTAQEEGGDKPPPSIPPCPPRLKLMVYSKSLWSRQSPDPRSCYSTETRGGPLSVSAREEKEQHEILITLPQEDQVMTVLEMSEDLDLMDFHVRTLEAFCAVCSHSNMTLAKSISQYIGSEQLLKCLQVSGRGMRGWGQGAWVGGA